MTIAVREDPGSLDPHKTSRSSAFELARFAYDSLVHVDSTGKVVSGLASTWTPSGTSHTFTLKKGVTCADGSPITATLVADNLKFASNPANGSPLLGLSIPAKLKVAGDDTAGTVTTDTKAPVAFFLEGLATVPIVCKAGMSDRNSLTGKTLGSGPYVLTAAVPNDRYTYRLRDGYAWGPGGVSTHHLPKTVIFRVVENETTTANLLLSRDVNIGSVAGPDRDRLSTQGLFRHDVRNIDGEIFYNQAPGRATADERVRRALTMALDLRAIGKVLTGGYDSQPTGMITLEPRVCTADTVTGNLPTHDASAAKALLEEAGWKVGERGVRQKEGKSLSLDLLTSTEQNRATASELAIEQWKAIGAEVKPIPKIPAEINATLFDTAAWDISWSPLQAQLPSQLVPFLSGPPPSKGGTNFAHLDNAEYEKAAAQAGTLPGAAGCDLWAKAEAALIKHADVVPYVGKVYPVWGRGYSFESTAFGLVPTSLQPRAS
ncbi:ABC transporter substrate-binding protein [Nonomuraea zeae]|uniref:ABC transporter substrate-binding protein n=1 Tax=Nonomuraea zeae TaxID=1642303 RepID=UPI0014786925|nr:ABC transporter substrate-binding protein [Nonomuraea zeae]